MEKININLDEIGTERATTRHLGSFRPMTVEEADIALVNGLIGVQDYSRCLVAIEPLVDTLADGDSQIRKSATFELKKRGGRNAVKLLEQALDDPNEEVRLFAAEALEKLDCMYNEAINGLIGIVREKPSVRLHFLLGKLYFDYAYKGMYDEGMRQIYFEKAVMEFQRAVSMQSDKWDWRLFEFLGSAYYELGKNEEALKCFDQIAKSRGEDADLLVRIAAVRFAQKRYKDVKKLCSHIIKNFEVGEYSEILEFWTS